MKKATLERELLVIVKQIEEDLSSPCSPQEMQWFIDRSLGTLADVERRLMTLIQQKESSLKRFVCDAVVMIAVGITIVYIVVK